MCRRLAQVVAPPNHRKNPSHPARSEGRTRRHERWCGIQWTRAATQDERRELRTAKSCGPDAPTLASSSRSNPLATVARKPGHRGEHDISRKTIVQGRSGELGEPVA